MSRALVLKSRSKEGILIRDFLPSDIQMGQSIEVKSTYYNYHGKGLVTNYPSPESFIYAILYGPRFDKCPMALNFNEVAGIYR